MNENAIQPGHASGWTHETLEKFLLAKIDLVRADLAAADKARDLQAKEYERRLSDLNGEHRRLDSVQATYVRNDIYEKDREELRKERGVQQERADASRRAAVVAWTAGAIALVGWALTGIGFYLRAVTRRDMHSWRGKQVAILRTAKPGDLGFDLTYLAEQVLILLPDGSKKVVPLHEVKHVRFGE